MTISPWLIYFADLADTIGNLFIVLTVITGIASAFFIICKLDREDDVLVRIAKWRRLTIPLFFIFLILSIFSPSTNTLYKMMIIPSVVNSNVVQKLPDELQQYIDKALKFKEEK
jgi:hypothetical protein